jgi:hypothetical protein
MVQQVHPGVSAPGGPQVTQGAPMMGQMPPGAGTAGPGPVQAHALSHLGPQAHMFQQPQFAQNCTFSPLEEVNLLIGLGYQLTSFFLKQSLLRMLR